MIVVGTGVSEKNPIFYLVKPFVTDFQCLPLPFFQPIGMSEHIHLIILARPKFASLMHQFLNEMVSESEQKRNG